MLCQPPEHQDNPQSRRNKVRVPMQRVVRWWLTNERGTLLTLRDHRGAEAGICPTWIERWLSSNTRKPVIPRAHKLETHPSDYYTFILRENYPGAAVLFLHD